MGEVGFGSWWMLMLDPWQQENCSKSSFGIFGNSQSGFFLVGIHVPLTHVMPEHKIPDTLLTPLAQRDKALTESGVRFTNA